MGTDSREGFPEDGEGPARRVWVDPFSISAATVTNRQFAAFVEATDINCRWAGTRLPSEAEWEYAALGEREGLEFPWSTELVPNGQYQCNTWQGAFPSKNTANDGYAGTAPFDAYRPNDFGLYNVCGNVWEWCTDCVTTPTATAIASPPARVIRRTAPRGTPASGS